jgi:hypothetical protein
MFACMLLQKMAQMERTDPARSAEIRAEVSIMRRHLILVEYVIGMVKRNWPLPGSCEGVSYSKNASFHGPAFFAACSLQQWMWNQRGFTLRTEAYFSG